MNMPNIAAEAVVPVPRSNWQPPGAVRPARRPRRSWYSPFTSSDQVSLDVMIQGRVTRWATVASIAGPVHPAKQVMEGLHEEDQALAMFTITMPFLRARLVRARTTPAQRRNEKNNGDAVRSSSRVAPMLVMLSAVLSSVGGAER